MKAKHLLPALATVLLMATPALAQGQHNGHDRGRWNNAPGHQTSYQQACAVPGSYKRPVAPVVLNRPVVRPVVYQPVVYRPVVARQPVHVPAPACPPQRGTASVTFQVHL